MECGLKLLKNIVLLVYYTGQLVKASVHLFYLEKITDYFNWRTARKNKRLEYFRDQLGHARVEEVLRMVKEGRH